MATKRKTGRTKKMTGAAPKAETQQPSHIPEIMDTATAAAYLGVSRQWLEIGRCRGYGPPYSKCGRRMVRYQKKVLDLWLAGREQQAE